ncbi:MAG: hypothetical protein ACYTGB_06555 [Planctomycetota bacterium]|jgi:hypothetical protein
MRARLLPAAAAILLAAAPLSAAELWESADGESKVSLTGALKASLLVSRAPDDPFLYPERDSTLGLFRGRLMLKANRGEVLDAELAYEQRVRLVTEDAGVAASGGGVVPASDRVPYRIEQWDWEIDEDDDGTSSWRHEIDRALVAWHPSWGEVVVGRQAVGLGRGTLFSAVDVFSPFAPAEIDREWRRGIDAARAEWRVSDTFSAEIISAWGESWDESALLGRVRGYVGRLDAELLAGKRGEDLMYALTVSAAVGEAEVHAEAAVFYLDEDWAQDGLFGNDRLVGKAVLGASYTFALGEGLSLTAEYHYSGFGAEDIEDLPVLAFSPEFRERMGRGESQILSRHALGLQTSYPLNDEWSTGLLLLLGPADGSGLCSPSAVWNPNDATTVTLSVFLPWGEESANGVLESEYGANPLSLFLQVAVYF